MNQQPFVPEKTDLREFTLKALILGVIMTVILGAANAYLGLRAGMTIAATYPAAVIGMAILKLMRGSILEENMARTVGSIGESVAAGAIFTIPAFVISGAWLRFDTVDAYLKSSALMFVGGLLGIMFVTFLRRVMVTDPELGFPESVAASEIHKAGQKGSQGAKFLFQAMGIGAVLYTLGAIKIFAATKEFFIKVGNIGASFVRLGTSAEAPVWTPGDRRRFGTRDLPRLHRRRLHHRPPAGLAQFRRRGPGLGTVRSSADVFPRSAACREILRTGSDHGPSGLAGHDARRLEIHHPADRRRRDARRRRIHPFSHAQEFGSRNQKVRRRCQESVRPGRGGIPPRKRFEHSAGPGIARGDGRADGFVYRIFSGSLPRRFWPPLSWAGRLFFAAVSGNLVGQIGSSNNPISGLTLST